MLTTLRENLSTIFVQIQLLNSADFPASQVVKVWWKSHMKIGLSCAKTTVGYMTFAQFGQLVGHR